MKWYQLQLLFILLAGTTVKAQDADVQQYDLSLTLNDTTNRIAGTTGVTVRYVRDVTSFRLALVGPSLNDTGMTVTSVQQDGAGVPFTQDSAGINLSVNAREGAVRTYIISYAGIPADGLIISTNKFGKRTFFTDNWPDRAHNWFPCIDHPGDKAAVNFTIIAPDHYQVVANGLKTEETSLPGKLKRTRYREKVPLPSKVIAVGVADFAIDHPADVSGIPVYTYVFPENKDRGFRDYAKAVDILRFFIKKIGPYPYEKLANIQSKTIFGGMENAGAIFYAERSVGSRTIEELMAHEIAHQWFGDAVTETDWQHLWLSEGFATYMAWVYLESKYGSDTLRKGMAADRWEIIAFGRTRNTPVVDTTVKDHYMQLLNVNSYQKGSWVLHMLRRRLSDVIFWKGIRQYFATYSGKNANTDNFREVMEQVSGQDLKGFFKQWLQTAGVPVLNIRVEPVAAKDSQLVTIEQQQEPLFDFWLEYNTRNNKKVSGVDVKGKTTTLGLHNGAILKVDPNVNILAEIRLIQ